MYGDASNTAHEKDECPAWKRERQSKRDIANGKLSYAEAAAPGNERRNGGARSVSDPAGIKSSGRLTAMEETSTRAFHTTPSDPMTARHRLRYLWIIISEIPIETVQIRFAFNPDRFLVPSHRSVKPSWQNTSWETIA